MNDDSKNIGLREDEIDLIALLERSISFFKKNKWIFLSAILVGLLLGYLRYRSLPVVYKSRLVAHSFVLTNQNDIQIVEGWNAVLKSGDYAALVNTFNLSENILNKVKQIKAEEIQKIFTPSNPNGFTIEVFVTDNSILPALQKGLVYGFNNSDYVKERLIAKRSRLQEIMDKTSIELKKLDSTKKLVENIISGKGSSSSSLIVDASNINRQWIDMNEKLLSLKEDLKFSNAVEVLSGFSKFKNPAGPNLYMWLFLGLISGLSIAYIYSLFRSINQKLRNRALIRKVT
ncbi:MAG: hypothetical protein ABI675_14800 [Chitinophagaceae bacterium]